MIDRARFRALLEQAAGLEVSHYVRPKRGAAGAALSWLVRAGAHTLAVRQLADARAAPVSFAAARLRAAAAGLGPATIPLLLVPRMGPVGASICAERGVAYLDLEGNARIEAQGLRVRVERPRPPRRPRGRPASPFAPRASRVARVLLREPQRGWRQKELASASGLGPGYVSRIVRCLEEQGLLSRNRAGLLRLADPVALFDAWRADYAFRPGAVIERCAPAHELPVLLGELAATLGRLGLRHAATGLAALWCRGATATLSSIVLYVSELPPSDLPGGLPERPAAPNVRLAVPRDPALPGDVETLRGVPCLDVYGALLDVEGIPEVGAAEAAQLRRALLPRHG